MKSFPIGVRLTAWYFGILAAVLSLFSLTAYFAMRNSVYRAVDQELLARMEGVRRLIERTARYEPEDLRRELREHSELAGNTLLQVADRQGNWLYRSASVDRYEIPRPAEGSPLPSTLVLNNAPLRVLTTEIQAGDQSYFAQAAVPLADFYSALHLFATLLLVSIPILLLSAAAGGYWMSRRALAPVDQITRTARNISVQNLSSRLIVPQTGDELQRLSETLNSMLARLEAAFKRIIQFTADASHELRTPVAVMRTRTELSLRKPRSADEYRETVAQVHSELEKTSDLVERLMLLARADYGVEALQISTGDLGEIVHEVCSQGKTLSEAKQIDFKEQMPDYPVWVKADAHALRRLFLILIDNAIKYTPEGGRVEVVVGAKDGFAIGEVRDTGIGIAPEHLPNVFERFYRADKARSRESGGVGLGLSIGRWIAEAHAGTIEVQSSPGGGSVFTLRLPLDNGKSRGLETAN
jgi:heavy metal sensor kinase